MNTDFRGVTTNGKNILCYGDYGIITYTLDYGKTFQRVNIGDKYSIKSIKAIGDNFIGATDYSLIKSTDGGLHWENKELFDSPQILDMAVSASLIYVLTPIGIFTADSNLKVTLSPIVLLDSKAEYTELEVEGSDMYIIYNKKYLLHYSMDTKQWDTTNVLKAAVESCGNCVSLSRLKLSGNTLYCTVNGIDDPPKYSNYKRLVKSDTKGKSWKKLTESILLGGYFKIDTGNTVYGLCPRTITISNTALLGLEYLQIDTAHYARDTSDYKIINEDRNQVDRAIRNSSQTDQTDFREIINVTKDILVAVGTNNIIVMSYNNGKTWEIKSFFNSIVRDIELVSFPSKNIGYVLNSLSYFRTVNGGITWLPQKFSDYPQIAPIAPNSFYFNSSGKGYVKTITKNAADTNILTTNDYGETYSLQYSDSLTHYKYENNSSFGISSPKGLEVGNFILYFISRYVKDSTGANIYSYTVLRYDKNFRLTDTVVLNCNNIISKTVTDDSSIILLASNNSGTNQADSMGYSKDYSYSYFFLKSTDKGKTWDSLKIKIPISRTLLQHYSKAYYSYSNDIYSNCALRKDKYILYPSFSKVRSVLGYNLIYRFDYVNNRFDSIKIPTKLSSTPNSMFSFGNTVYAISSMNNIFFTQNIGADVPIWDSIASSYVFGNWESFDPDIPFDGTNAIFSTYMPSDTVGFLVIGTSRTVIGGRTFRMNVVKLSPKGITSVDEPKTEEDVRVSLWNYKPYPIPGTNTIQCKIYWNKHYNIDDATIKVYDVYGTAVQSQEIRVNKLQDNLGILEWDCSEVPSGVYVIHITLGGESRSFPVIVVK
jgi:photosystem II stability/assembly factor-like uncharacterized protein